MGKQYVIFEIDNGKFGYEFVRACYKIAGEGTHVNPPLLVFSPSTASRILPDQCDMWASHRRS